ncbi:MAG: glycosyltransferase family 39 protein [Anaerolineales bacterium]|nr:glycosyltransferase family 39 protein [Anaerolineales bacterium]
MLKRLSHIPAPILLIALAAALRFVNLGSESLWYDESFTAWVSKLDFQSMIEAIRGDVHPPLSYILTWGVVRVFGDSEFALRLIPALFGCLAPVLIHRIARAIHFERRTALTAGLIAAVLPGLLYYSQDARMYPELVVFVLVTVWGAVSKSGGLFLIGGVGAAYTQNYGLFYIAAISVAMFFTHHRTGGVIRVAVIAAAYLPWLPVMLSQTGDVADGFWIPSLTFPAAILPAMTNTMGTRIADMFQIHLYGGALMATVIGIYASRRWLFRGRGLIILAAIFGAPFLAAVLSWVWKPIYLSRGLLPSAVLIALVWAYALHHLSRGNRRVMGAILIPALIIGVISHYAVTGRDDWRSWVQPVRTKWEMGDVIYNTAVHTTINLGYYLQGYPYRLRPHASDLNQSLTETTKVAMKFHQDDFDDLPAQGYRRAWLMFALNPMSRRDEKSEIARILTHYPNKRIAVKSGDYYEVAIYLVELNEGVTYGHGH